MDPIEKSNKPEDPIRLLAEDVLTIAGQLSILSDILAETIKRANLQAPAADGLRDFLSKTPDWKGIDDFSKRFRTKGERAMAEELLKQLSSPLR